MRVETTYHGDDFSTRLAVLDALPRVDIVFSFQRCGVIVSIDQPGPELHDSTRTQRQKPRTTLVKPPRVNHFLEYGFGSFHGQAAGRCRSARDLRARLRIRRGGL